MTPLAKNEDDFLKLLSNRVDQTRIDAAGKGAVG
jgi:hypothetical protein